MQHSSTQVLTGDPAVRGAGYERGEGVRVVNSASVAEPLTVSNSGKLVGIALQNTYAAGTSGTSLDLNDSIAINCTILGNAVITGNYQNHPVLRLTSTNSLLVYGCAVTGMHHFDTSHGAVDLYAVLYPTDAVGCFLHNTIYGFSDADETPDVGNTRTAFWSPDTGDPAEGAQFFMNLFVAPEDANFTARFCRDANGTSFPNAHGLGNMTSDGGSFFPGLSLDNVSGINESGIFGVETDKAQEAWLDADGVNVGDVKDSGTLDWSLWQTDARFLNLFEPLFYDAHGGQRKSTPGADEPGNLSPPVLSVLSVTNNAVQLNIDALGLYAQANRTQVVEQTGDFSAPFADDLNDPATLIFWVIGLDERVDWYGRTSLKDIYGWLSGTWSNTVSFTTTALLSERPRLGEPGTFGRGSEAYFVDRKGVLQVLQDSIARFNWILRNGVWRRTLLLEKAAENKVYRNTDFSDDLTTGWTKTGDAAATLTVVDDTEKLRDVGLLPWAPAGKVLKLDNSAGATPAQAQNDNSTGNTNKHSVSAFIRGGSGLLAIEASGASFGASTTYRRVRYENVTPAAGTDNFVIEASVGQVVYFILGQMEEEGWASSPIPNPAVAATETRAGDEVSFELPNALVVPGELTVYLRFIAQMDSAGGVERKFFQISDRLGSTPYLWLGQNLSGAYKVERHNGAASQNAAIPIGVMDTSRGDEVEVVWVSRADGTGRLIVSQNYDTLAGTEFATLSFAGTYSDDRFYLNGGPFGEVGAIALVDVKLLDREILGGDQDILNSCRTVGYKKAK
jgi:hypothetical protein